MTVYQSPTHKRIPTDQRQAALSEIAQHEREASDQRKARIQAMSEGKPA